MPSNNRRQEPPIRTTQRTQKGEHSSPAESPPQKSIASDNNNDGSGNPASTLSEQRPEGRRFTKSQRAETKETRHDKACKSCQRRKKRCHKSHRIPTTSTELQKYSPGDIVNSTACRLQPNERINNFLGDVQGPSNNRLLSAQVHPADQQHAVNQPRYDQNGPYANNNFVSQPPTSGLITGTSTAKEYNAGAFDGRVIAPSQEYARSLPGNLPRVPVQASGYWQHGGHLAPSPFPGTKWNRDNATQWHNLLDNQGSRAQENVSTTSTYLSSFPQSQEGMGQQGYGSVQANSYSNSHWNPNSHQGRPVNPEQYGAIAVPIGAATSFDHSYDTNAQPQSRRPSDASQSYYNIDSCDAVAAQRFTSDEQAMSSYPQFPFHDNNLPAGNHRNFMIHDQQALAQVSASNMASDGLASQTQFDNDANTIPTITGELNDFQTEGAAVQATWNNPFASSVEGLDQPTGYNGTHPRQSYGPWQEWLYQNDERFGLPSSF